MRRRMRNRCGGPGDRFLGREVLHGASLEAFLGIFAFFLWHLHSRACILNGLVWL